MDTDTNGKQDASSVVAGLIFVIKNELKTLIILKSSGKVQWFLIPTYNSHLALKKGKEGH